MPAGTVLLFCHNHFIDVCCHMLLQLYSLCYTGHGKMAKNSVRPRWLRKQSGLWYIVKHVWRPAIAGPVSWQWILCTQLETLRCVRQLIQAFFLTFNQAVSGARRPEFIWRVRRQRWCL